MNLSYLPKQVELIFDEAVYHLDNTRIKSSDPIIRGIQKDPLSANKQEQHSQFFTPADVALYCAIELYCHEKSPVSVFDPCLGMGSLLIASGFILAEQLGLRNLELLRHLHGNEIDSETREEGIENIYTSLSQYLRNCSKKDCIEILSQNISCEDANLLNKNLSSYVVIMNPPYKEDVSTKKGNQWISIVDHILNLSPRSFCFILPVSVSSSSRANSVRNQILQKYNQIKAFHHEIRPRPLFKGVEQRISIVFGRNGKGEVPSYETTGFLTHRAGNRASIWSEASTKLNPPLNTHIFPKISTNDYEYFNLIVCRKDNRKSLEEYAEFHKDSKLIDVWVRTTGRYHLLAQKQCPEDVSSKWKKVAVPEPIVDKFIETFTHGDLLRWWKIFGDGRDISIRSIKTEYIF